MKESLNLPYPVESLEPATEQYLLRFFLREFISQLMLWVFAISVVTLLAQLLAVYFKDAVSLSTFYHESALPSVLSTTHEDYVLFVPPQVDYDFPADKVVIVTSSALIVRPSSESPIKSSSALIVRPSSALIVWPAIAIVPDLKHVSQIPLVFVNDLSFPVNDNSTPPFQDDYHETQTPPTADSVSKPFKIALERLISDVVPTTTGRRCLYAGLAFAVGTVMLIRD
jgi:hypothetical protein